MVALREVLSRFRPAGVAGAATGAAVPADRTADRDAELAPVFASLDGTEAEVREIRARAVQKADAIRADAERHAQELLRNALARAPLERERAAQQTRLETDEYCAAVLERSTVRVESIRRQAESRIRVLVERTVAELFARLLLGESGPYR